MIAQTWELENQQLLFERVISQGTPSLPKILAAMHSEIGGAGGALPTLSPPFRWSGFIKFVGVVSVILLLCGLGGCRQSARQPVTVTVLDPEWSQPDELSWSRASGAGVHSRNRNSGQTLSGSGNLTQSTKPGVKVRREVRTTPDVVAIDMIWPGMLDGSSDPR
jgi:hypothetical protein